MPERVRHGKATAVGGATGAVAGLVAITPAAGFVGPVPALLIGLAGGAACFAAVELKSRIGYDDSLDAVGVHMVGGLVGALLTGVFASLAVNPAGADGGSLQIGRQGAARASRSSLVRGHLGDPEARRPVRRFPRNVRSRGGGCRRDRARGVGVCVPRARTSGDPPLKGMTEEELVEMRERLVLEATARVLEAIDARVDDDRRL